MKKWIALVLAMACMLSLTSCGAEYPERALDGTAWSESWTMLGKSLGVEEILPYGLTLQENPVVLTGDDTYYATWSIGEPTAYVNEDGHDTDLYPAQLYLLFYGCADKATAQQAVVDWMERESNTYTVTNTEAITASTLNYTVLQYQCVSESNPYQRGVSAFAVYDSYAVSAELSCTDTFDGDEQQILYDFLNLCHYAEPEKK